MDRYCRMDSESILKLTCDSREKKVIATIKEKNLFPFDVIDQLLSVGDFLINDLHGKKIMIIERKTYEDLFSSLTDGRFSEQKSRLLASEYNKIAYILEGNDNFDEKKRNLVKQIEIRLQLKYGIHVLHSKCPEDTANLLKILMLKLSKDPSYHTKQDVRVSYIECIKTEKKENMTVKRCVALQISMIPGISKKTAEIISEKYETLKNLIETLEKDEQEFVLFCKEKNLKIGKKKIETLKKYFSVI